jgi:hypothetical protein
MTIELDRGAHTLRCPSLLEAVDILAEIEGLTDAVQLAAGAELAQISDAIGIIRSAGPRALRALGALIGISWQHAEVDLEASAGADLMSYGADVYQELHEAGYTFSDLALLAGALVAEVWKQAQLEEEVTARLSTFRDN